ncbi:MAG: GTP-binding protein [Sneathiella sp.]
MDKEIPVTVIGGYLGAGKTTLLNGLLTGRHGKRLAVLVNDFGSVNIDASLIETNDGDTISLSNGCVCCSIADDLGQALSDIAAWQEPPDQVFIEASGVADPEKIARYGQGWPGFELALVLTLIDAETIRSRAQDKFVGGLVVRQMQAADIIVINKIDLVQEKEREALDRWMETKTGGQKMITAIHAHVPQELLLSHDFDSVMQGQGGKHVRQISLMEPDHSHQFATSVFKANQMMSGEKLGAVLDSLPASVIRAKGFVTLAEAPQKRHILQMVGRRWTLMPEKQAPCQPSDTIITLIGLRNEFDAAALHKEFERTLVPELGRVS